jgi:hypothetical protein
MSLLASNSTIAAITNPVPANSNVVLLPVNQARKGFAIYNAGTGTLNIAFGVAASATVYSVSIAAATGFYESKVDYTGPVNGFWSATGGSCSVTEFS